MRLFKIRCGVFGVLKRGETSRGGEGFQQEGPSATNGRTGLTLPPADASRPSSLKERGDKEPIDRETCQRPILAPGSRNHPGYDKR